MGNKVCQRICSDISDEKAQYFLNKSPHEWVRKMDIKKCEKQIVSAKTNDA
jgi:hypothetical protein